MAVEELNKEIQRLSEAITALTPNPTQNTTPPNPVVQTTDTKVLEAKVDELNRQLTSLANELSALRNAPTPEPKVIQVPSEPKVIQIPSEPKIIQIPSEPKIIKVPAETKIVQIPSEPKIIQVPATTTQPVIQPTPPPVINYTPPPVIQPVPETRIIQPVYDFCEELLQRRVEIFFDHNSAKVKALELEKLSEVVSTLNECPDARVTVNGHADKTGNAQYNLKLSKRRAEAVKYKLVNEYGLETYRLLMNFYGEELADGIGKDPFARKVVLKYVR